MSEAPEPPFPVTARIAVIAPHPDDFDAIGVALRLCRDAGMDLELAVLTGGASGVEDGYRGVTTPGAKGDLREEEQRASCRFFGLADDRVTFLRLAEDAEGDLAPDPANRKRLRAYLLERRPNVVFMPHGNDSNADHRHCHAMVDGIAREERLAVLACLNRDPKTIAMRADLYAGFGDEVAAWKAELLRFHQSQHRRNLNTRGHGFDERILRVNRQIAAELGGAWPYAESFQVERLGMPGNRGALGVQADDGA